MSGDSQAFALGNALPIVRGAVDAGLQSFQDASQAYDRQGTALEAKAIEELTRYLDPDAGRALEIQEAARALIAELQAFADVHIRLMGSVGMLGLAMNTAILGVELETLRGLATAGPVEASREGVEAFMSHLDQAQKRNVYLGLRAVAVGLAVAGTYTAAAEFIDARQAKLASYVADVAPPNKADKLLTAARSTMRGVGVELLQHALPAAAAALGVSIPIAGVAASLAIVVRDVRQRVNAVEVEYQAGYQRGTADALLDFRRQVSDENGLMNAFVELSDELANDLAALDLGRELSV